jgi:protein-disulfide isomerase
MASRTKQKEEARARRLAEEQARAERERRNRRTRMLAGIILAAVAVVAVLIAVSLGNSGSGGLKKGKQATALTRQINTLLAGIPESGNTLGNPAAKVTVTEFGDLECPICRDFALGSENQLIQNDVRSGKVKLVYRSLDTATGNGPNASEFGVQQAGALAAGLQNKEWYYIELFYHEQGQEGSGYAVPSFFDSIAQQIVPYGLNYSSWLSNSQSTSLISQVTADEASATSKGYASTPTIVATGPKGQGTPIVGNPQGGYDQLESAIKQVS